jgi:hypothetical protein
MIHIENPTKQSTSPTVQEADSVFLDRVGGHGCKPRLVQAVPTGSDFDLGQGHICAIHNGRTRLRGCFDDSIAQLRTSCYPVGGFQIKNL